MHIEHKNEPKFGKEVTGTHPVMPEKKIGPRTEGVMAEFDTLVRTEKDPGKMVHLVKEYAQLVLDEAESAGNLPAGAVEWLFGKGKDERRDQVRERVLRHVALKFDDLRSKPGAQDIKKITEYFLAYAIPSISSPFQMAKNRKKMQAELRVEAS